MTIYYVDGISGSDSNNGTSVALAKLSLGGAEALSLVGGDRIRCRATTYRETHTTSHDGGSAYTTGTVSVTNGSPIVTGSGTSWLANSFADGWFQSIQLAHGTDGVTNGTATFSSSSGNFQASMIGLTIRINTKGAFVISAVASATSITLKNSDGTTPSPSAGSSLTYDVGPESPYLIQSVDSNTQITLTENWHGPTLTGISYKTWQDIRFIADEAGVWFATGGELRITGSDDDKTVTRTNNIACGNSYRTWIGFHCDGASNAILMSAGINQIIKQCAVPLANGNGFVASSTGQSAISILKCIFDVCAQRSIVFNVASAVDNAGNIVENCLIRGGVNSLSGVGSIRCGGILVRNCTIVNVSNGVKVETAVTVGQAISVNNSIVAGCSTPFAGTTTNDVIEDYNAVSSNANPRSNTRTGAHDNTDLWLHQSPLLTMGYMTWLQLQLLSVSELTALAGLFPPNDDLYSTARPATPSWGAVQYVASQRPADANEPRGRRG